MLSLSMTRESLGERLSLPGLTGIFLFFTFKGK